MPGPFDILLKPNEANQLLLLYSKAPKVAPWSPSMAQRAVSGAATLQDTTKLLLIACTSLDLSSLSNQPRHATSKTACKEHVSPCAPSRLLREASWRFERFSSHRVPQLQQKPTGWNMEFEGWRIETLASTVDLTREDPPPASGGTSRVANVSPRKHLCESNSQWGLGFSDFREGSRALM